MLTYWVGHYSGILRYLQGAIVSFTKSLALDEGRHGVRVNCVSPGAILTPLMESVTDPKIRKDFSDISVSVLSNLSATSP